MRQHVSTLRATARGGEGDESPLSLLQKPLLRYSDAGGITTDASVWGWGDRGRPAALAGIFFLTQDGQEPKWSCELLSLSDGAVAVESEAGWKWQPAGGNLRWLMVDDKPLETARLRLRQMKGIAERYEVTSFEGQIKTQQRLMVQPLHRYDDFDNDLIDGAIFAFATGTNPEALLITECRRAERGSAAWHVAFTRFGANAYEARDGENVVWKCTPVQRWDAKDAYFSRFGTAEQVFQAIVPK